MEPVVARPSSYDTSICCAALLVTLNQHTAEGEVNPTMTGASSTLFTVWDLPFLAIVLPEASLECACERAGRRMGAGSVAVAT